MKGFNKDFANIRKLIRKGGSEEAIDKLTRLQEDIRIKTDRYLTIIEVQNKKCCSVDQRYVEVLEAEGSTHRLTVNPVSGRITLKVSKKATEVVTSELVEVAKQLLELDLPPVTLRGKITWHKYLGYQCQLISESKKFKKSISYKTEEK